MGLKGCTWDNRVKIRLLPCNHFQLLCFDLFNPFLGMKIELMLAVNMEHITFLVFKNKNTSCKKLTCSISMYDSEFPILILL